MSEPFSSGPQPAGKQRSDTKIPTGTTLFGVYEVEGVLGGGGMGWVYRARHKQLSTLRAIKVIRPDLLTDPNMEKLFVREAHALMEIHHDAVVRCHDLLEEDGQIYLIMELVQGPSLEEILKDGPISTQETMALLKRIASGLAAAHALGVVHRDISPGNIILPNGRPEEAKLIDFGVAAVAAVPGQTMVGDFKGKLAYASPEQFGLFGGKVDHRSDIYSLGLVLAEAASGAPIPMGQTFYEAVELRKVKPRIPPNVPQALQAELMPLLEPDPKKRVQTASALAEARPIEIIDNTETREKQVPLDATSPQPVHWLIPLLYSASAVGIGIGLGFMIWIYRSAGAVPTTVPVTSTVPAVAPAAVPGGVPPSSPGVKPVVPDPAKPISMPQPKVQLPPPTVAKNLKTPVAATVLPTVPTLPASASGGTVSRAEVMQTAESLSKFTWKCGDANLRAPCVRNAAYVSDWQSNEQVTGLPYNWGGFDSPQEFERKLHKGLGAGSHKRHGIATCTAGIDCSGFVAYCWGRRQGGHNFSTATMDVLSTRSTRNLYNGLKPGDALNKPGSHIVLFAGYRPDGGPIVYEASGSAGRVIRNDKLSWSRLNGYHAVQSNSLTDP